MIFVVLYLLIVLITDWTLDPIGLGVALFLDLANHYYNQEAERKGEL